MEKSELNKSEKKMIVALAQVTFLPASFDKRFYKGCSVYGVYSEKQKKYLHFIFNKYRKQIRGYEDLAMELYPDRFNLEVNFNEDLFNSCDIKIKDTFKPTRKLN